MSTGTNLRVFRRNAKNIIIIWNNAQMEEKYHRCAGVFLVGDDGVERPLISNKFVPDNPEKFSNDVDGMIVSHSSNSLDPSKIYNIRVMFGSDGDMIVFDKQVMSTITEFGKPEPAGETIVHMYGFDYDAQKWVPLPVDPKTYTR
jgi:hypothetical protein